jgi:hypothetical protein
MTAVEDSTEMITFDIPVHYPNWLKIVLSLVILSNKSVSQRRP